MAVNDGNMLGCFAGAWIDSGWTVVVPHIYGEGVGGIGDGYSKGFYTQ